jgi:hypothetical protein
MSWLSSNCNAKYSLWRNRSSKISFTFWAISSILLFTILSDCQYGQDSVCFSYWRYWYLGPFQFFCSFPDCIINRLYWVRWYTVQTLCFLYLPAYCGVVVWVCCKWFCHHCILSFATCSLLYVFKLPVRVCAKGCYTYCLFHLVVGELNTMPLLELMW